MRLREIIAGRDSARQSGYQTLERAERFFGGMHPDSIDMQVVKALREALEALDEQREVIFAYITNDRPTDPSPPNPGAGDGG